MHYIPRILAIIITLFLGIFILEGIGPEFGWRDSLMHALPTLIVLGMTITAWKKPRMGGWMFVVFGILLLIFIHPLWWNGLVIGGVPLVTGMLFLAIKPKQ